MDTAPSDSAEDEPELQTLHSDHENTDEIDSDILHNVEEES